MRFTTLESQFAKCDEHLILTATAGSEVEFYLTQFLLVRICAEFETRIKLLVERRCSRANDIRVKTFVQNASYIICRNFDISDIKGEIIKKFGGDYAKNFRDLLDDELISAWNNIYINRQAASHAVSPQMSLRDLKEHYQKSLAVFDAIVLALELKPRDLRNMK